MAPAPAEDLHYTIKKRGLSIRKKAVGNGTWVIGKAAGGSRVKARGKRHNSIF
jgi:hypothetical protein